MCDPIDLRTWRYRHARASLKTAARLAADMPARTSRDTMSDFPDPAAKATSVAQYADGMPRSRQPLTVDFATLRPAATAPVPPNASMMVSQVMDATIVRAVRTRQGVADGETTFRQDYGPIGSMDTDKDIAARLVALREREGLNQTQFASEIGLAKNIYNPFEKGARPLTLDAARRIRRRFGVSIDWLLFGDVGQPGERIARELGPTPRKEVIVRESRKVTG